MITQDDILAFDRLHQKRIQKFSKRVQRYYSEVIKEVAASAANLSIKNPDKEFNIDDYPQLKRKVDVLLKKLSVEIEIDLKNSMRDEWSLAGKKNDYLINNLIQYTSVPKSKLRRYYNRNLEAMDAFIQRKINGLGLSERIWKTVSGLKNELNMALDVGLGEGKPAAELSRDIRKYLQDPDMLFRRVRDKRGNLVLSKRAKKYNPGQGKYRSSYKNAMRLTRTEINMSYRVSDQKRIGQLDFVVGYEIKLSGQHPVYDICDELQGKYPKWFIFKGWHPQCLCHVETILATPSEFNEMTKKILAGEDPTTVKSKNTVKNVPDAFNDWVINNTARAQNWKSMPYFIQDNFIDGDITKGLKIN